MISYKCLNIFSNSILEKTCQLNQGLESFGKRSLSKNRVYRGIFPLFSLTLYGITTSMEVGIKVEI